MNFLRGRVLAAAALVLALALAGCGSDGDETTSDGATIATNSLSKAEYVEKANAICADAYSEITRKYEAFYEAERRTVAELDNKAMEVVVPNLEILVKRLKELGAPQGQEPKIEKIIAALEKGIKTAKADESTVRGAEGNEFAFEKPYKLMWAYGLNKCGLD